MELTAHKKEVFRKMYEDGATAAQISREIGFHIEEFTEIREALGIPVRLQNMKRHTGGKLPAPDGLLEDAKTMILPALMNKYQLGRKMIMSILTDHGVEWKDGNVQRKVMGIRPVSPLIRREERVESEHDRAASHLRRYYSNVHRCDIKVYENQSITWGFLHEVPNGGRGYYFVDGKGVLKQDEMLALAREHGFDEGMANKLD
jgi:hypothetical protein